MRDEVVKTLFLHDSRTFNPLQRNEGDCLVLMLQTF